MNPDDFVVDMDINSMYASIGTNPCAEIPAFRILKNRGSDFNPWTQYKWKWIEPTVDHFEEEEDLFKI